MHQDYTPGCHRAPLDNSEVNYDASGGSQRSLGVPYDDAPTTNWSLYSNSEGASSRVRGDVAQSVPDRTPRSTAMMHDPNAWSSQSHRSAQVGPAAVQYSQRSRQAGSNEYAESVPSVPRRFTAPPSSYMEYDGQEQWQAQDDSFQGGSSSLPSSMEATANATYYATNFNGNPSIASSNAQPMQAHYPEFYTYPVSRGDNDAFSHSSAPFAGSKLEEG